MTPRKGEPDFSNLDYNTVVTYRDTVRDMIGAFSGFPKEKAVLTSVWKHLNSEILERCSTPVEEHDVEGTVSEFKTHKRGIIRRSKPIKITT